MTGPRFTPLVESLPSTVPFVGPETQERARGKPFGARIGANESVFGPSPRRSPPWPLPPPRCGSMVTRKTTT